MKMREREVSEEVVVKREEQDVMANVVVKLMA